MEFVNALVFKLKLNKIIIINIIIIIIIIIIIESARLVKVSILSDSQSDHAK